MLYNIFITKAASIVITLFLTIGIVYNGDCLNSRAIIRKPYFGEGKACNFAIIYDNQSYTAKGVTDRFLSVSKFNSKNEECWAEFAEYYYNMVPDNPDTIVQNVYVFESKGTIQIKNIQQYKANKSKLILIAIGYLNQKKETMTFKRVI